MYFATYKMLHATLPFSYDRQLAQLQLKCQMCVFFLSSVTFMICPSTTQHYRQKPRCCIGQDLKSGQAFYI